MDGPRTVPRVHAAAALAAPDEDGDGQAVSRSTVAKVLENTVEIAVSM